MLLNDKETLTRLNSPQNLINRLKNPRKDAMSLFVGSKREEVKLGTSSNLEPIVNLGGSASEPQTRIDFNPFTKPTEVIPEPPQILDTILKDSESQIKLGLAHDKSLDLLTRSVDMLAQKLDDIKADKLSSVVVAASKVVEGIRKERAESLKHDKDRDVHFHFYTPQQKKVEDFEIIDVVTSETSAGNGI